MTAQRLPKSNTNGTYHVYNKGVENKIIFNDDQDYNVFLGFLAEYLTPPQNPENTKKVFTVQGRTYRGVPHQPKNYFNKVDLIGYSLTPDRFHLIVQQKTKDSLEKFIRSLCTRYSMYFNKKYKRTGSLFDGPYKSVLIKEDLQLLHLTRHIHRIPLKEKDKDLNLIAGNSSYSQYLGIKKTSWVKPEVVLSYFNIVKLDTSKNINDYKDFVENYVPDQQESELLEGITFDGERKSLERRIPENEVKDLASNPQKASDTPSEIYSDIDTDMLPRKLDLLIVTVVFFILFGLGIRNVVMVQASKNINPEASPTTLGTDAQEVEEIKIVEEVKPKTMLKVVINDEATSVNIRQQPTVKSDKIGEANENDVFEYVSKDSEWYEIILADGTKGFISARYIEENNN